MNTTILVLGIYLVLMFLVAWFFSRKSDLEEYFVNKRKTGLWMMTFSTVATIVGAGAVVGTVAEVYNSGISYGIASPFSSIAAVFVLGLVAKKMKEIGDKYNVNNIADFFEKRFGKRVGTLMGVLQILLLVIWIAAQAIALASLASVLVDINYSLALFCTGAITILYTTIGGLKIDIITDFIQFWIILIVFIILAVFGYNQIGSLSSIFQSLPSGHLNPFNFNGVAWFVSAILIGGFIYLGNTTNWQRIFSAKDGKTARNSLFLSIPFMIFLSLLILFIGLVSAVLLKDVVIAKEMAIFVVIKQILPPALVGIGFAAILAVIMSSLDSLLIGGSAVVHNLFFKNKQVDDKKSFVSARIITMIFGIFGFLIAFIFPDIINLTLLLTYLCLIFAPAVFASLYSKTKSASSVFYSILIPSLLLFILFPILGPNSFMLPLLLSILIVIFYDKIFKSGEKKPVN